MINPAHWAGRSHPGPRTVPLALSEDQRCEVEAALRPEKAEQRIVKRGEALLLMAEGVSAPDIAKIVGVHERTVKKWRRRFMCDAPASKLADAPRSGRPPSLSRTPTPRGSSRKPVARPGT